MLDNVFKFIVADHLVSKRNYEGEVEFELLSMINPLKMSQYFYNTQFP